MKKYFLPTMIVMILLLPACGIRPPEVRKGSGNVVTQEESFSDFSALDISNSFDVKVMQGDEYHGIIRVDDNLVDILDVRVDNGTLRIGFKPNVYDHIENATLEAEVTMPVLVAVDMSNSSMAEISGFSSSDPFLADLTNSSTLRGDLVAGDTTVKISNSSSIELSGSGADLLVNASGEANVDLSDYPVGDASIDVSNSSTVTVNASGTLNVDATNSSTVNYLGNPTLGTIDTSNSSSVEAK